MNRRNLSVACALPDGGRTAFLLAEILSRDMKFVCGKLNKCEASGMRALSLRVRKIRQKISDRSALTAGWIGSCSNGGNYIVQ